MANINIGENDFSVLFEAANLALDSGRKELAIALDKLARKANAALTAVTVRRELPHWPGQVVPKISWRDTPSTLDRKQ